MDSPITAPWARCFNCNGDIRKGASNIPNGLGGTFQFADGYLRFEVTLYSGRTPGSGPGNGIVSTKYACLDCAPLVFKNYVEHVYK